MSECLHSRLCGLDDSAEPESHLCILHSQKPDKDKSAFEDAFRKHRRERGSDFRFIQFPAHADFHGQTFQQDVRFRGAIFMGNANFVETVFEKKADFGDATFEGEALFGRAQFKGNADFKETRFHGEGFFYRTVFAAQGEAEFGKARFEKEGNFFEAHFLGRSSFNEVQFSGEAVFIDCEFRGRANFNFARFDARATFLATVFGDSTMFQNTEFSTEAYFEGTIFEAGWATFQGANFRNRALFSGKFRNERPDGTKASRGTNRIFQGTTIDFRNVLTQEASSFVFRNADFQKVLFEDTNLHDVEFIDVLWPRVHGRSCVYDQRAPRNQQGEVLIQIAPDSVLPERGERTAWKENFPWASLEKLYRDLKRHHDDRRDYQRAGDFHYGEKEMQRCNPQSPRTQRFFLRLYKLASGYGEQYLRPLVGAAGVWLLSAVGYLFFGLHPKGDQTYLRMSKVWDWLHSLFFSFRVMSLLKPDEYTPVGYSVAVNTFENLLGPLFLGLFALALRQRLKR